MLIEVDGTTESATRRVRAFSRGATWVALDWRGGPHGGIPGVLQAQALVAHPAVEAMLRAREEAGEEWHDLPRLVRWSALRWHSQARQADSVLVRFDLTAMGRSAVVICDSAWYQVELEHALVGGLLALGVKSTSWEREVHDQATFFLPPAPVEIGRHLQECRELEQ